jgi:opacity protein-like surface antigen
MKNLFLSAILFLAPLSLFAEQYVGGNFGTTYLHQTKDSDSPKVGYRLGAVYGYLFDSGVRVEADFAFRNNEYSKKYVESNAEIASETSRSMHSWAMLANVLYDVNQLSTYNVVPYVGFGVGYAHNVEKIKVKSANATSEKKEDDRLAYQLIVGAKYPIADKVYAGVQYTYHVGRTHAKNHDASVHLVRNF